MKFDTPGTTVAATVAAIVTTNFGGLTEELPELHIHSGSRVYSVVATQARLLTQLAEKQPQVGDRISITYTRAGTPKRPGFNPPKFFAVEVTRATDEDVDGDDDQADDDSDQLDPEALV